MNTEKTGLNKTFSENAAPAFVLMGRDFSPAISAGESTGL
jgi:hypothetical protein